MSGADSLGAWWSHGNQDRDDVEGNNLRGKRTSSVLDIVRMDLTNGKLVTGVWSQGKRLGEETPMLEVV